MALGRKLCPGCSAIRRGPPSSGLPARSLGGRGLLRVLRAGMETRLLLDLPSRRRALRAELHEHPDRLDRHRLECAVSKLRRGGRGLLGPADRPRQALARQHGRGQPGRILEDGVVRLCAPHPVLSRVPVFGVYGAAQSRTQPLHAPGGLPALRPALYRRHGGLLVAGSAPELRFFNPLMVFHDYEAWNEETIAAGELRRAERPRPPRRPGSAPCSASS